MPKKADGLKSNLAQVDAHVIQPEEYEEIPELTEEFFLKGKLYQNGKPISRSPAPSQEQPVTLRLFSQEVLAYFQARGPGWQARVDAALKEWIAAH